MGSLSAVSKATSKIIDAFMDAKYAFVEVCVEFCILLGQKTLREFEAGVHDRACGGFSPVEQAGFPSGKGCRRPG